MAVSQPATVEISLACSKFGRNVEIMPRHAGLLLPCHSSCELKINITEVHSDKLCCARGRKCLTTLNGNVRNIMSEGSIMRLPRMNSLKTEGKVQFSTDVVNQWIVSMTFVSIPVVTL